MIKSGTCVSSEMIPITSQAECSWAAASIHYPDTIPAVVQGNIGRDPEGCQADTSGHLYLDVSPTSIGNPASRQRHPICKQRGRARCSGKIELESTAGIVLRDSRLEGFGSIQVTAGAILKEVSASVIQQNVSLTFANIGKTTIQTWRNNDWLAPTVDLRGSQQGGNVVCDASKSGQHSGCDRRAVCTDNEQVGGVRCACRGSVTELLSKPDRHGHSGAFDNGTICKQITNSIALFEQKSATLNIRKVWPSLLHYFAPMTLLICVQPQGPAFHQHQQPFVVSLSGESSMNTTVRPKHKAEYVVFLDKEYVNQYSTETKLSPSRPSKDNTVWVSIDGNQTKWSDNQETNVSVLVEANHNQKLDQTVQLILNMQPYPSCRHTIFNLSTSHIEHNDHMTAKILPHDTDDFLISRTQFKYRLIVRYAGDTKAVFDETDTASAVQSIQIPFKGNHLPAREGKYSVKLALLHGWDHERWEPQSCNLAEQHFFVRCADGSRPAHDRGNACVMIDRAKVCADAKIC